MTIGVCRDAGNDTTIRMFQALRDCSGSENNILINRVPVTSGDFDLDVLASVSMPC